MEALASHVDNEAPNSSELMFAILTDSGFISYADDSRLNSNETPSPNREFPEEISSTDSTTNDVNAVKKLALYESPEIIQRLNVFEEVEHGGIVTFECQCKGNPIPTSKWYKDDVELIEGDRITIEDSVDVNGILRLVIRNARKSDEGAYRCKLENQEGVAATTGYLSVTGANSPKSDHAISAAPLLRSITEESKASQDLEDETSTPLDKILTGEYDLTALPYSQYLELMKENSARNNGSGSAITPETPQSKTPESKDAQNGDVTPEITKDTHLESSNNDYVVITTETNQTPTTEKFENLNSGDARFLNDSETSFSADSVNSLESDDSVKVVSTYGLSVEPIQIVHENLGEDSFETELTEEAANLQTLQEENTELISEKLLGDVICDNDIKLDEKKLEDTIIVGRIGFPSDWEFEHYTAEMDEGEENNSTKHDDLLNNVSTGAIHDQNLNGIESAKEAETISDIEGGIKVPFNETGQDSLVFVNDSSDVSVETNTTNTAELLSASHELLTDSIQGPEFSIEIKENRNSEPDLELTESLPKSELGITGDSNINALAQTQEVTSDDFQEQEISLEVQVSSSNTDLELKPEVRPSSDEVSVSTPEMASVVAKEGDQSKPTISEEAQKSEAAEIKSFHIPGAGGEHLPEVKSVQGGNYTGPFNEFALPTDFMSPLPIPDQVSFESEDNVNVEVKAEEISSERVVQPAGDAVSEKTLSSSAESIFTNFVSDLSPTVSAIADWIPEVSSISSYFPSASPQNQSEKTAPVKVEDVEVSTVADGQSLVDWWVDWFRFPNFFYVLLVLVSTIVASATQSNPAALILLVALVSLICFQIFPVREVETK